MYARGRTFARWESGTSRESDAVITADVDPTVTRTFARLVAYWSTSITATGFRGDCIQLSRRIYPTRFASVRVRSRPFAARSAGASIRPKGHGGALTNRK